MAIHNMRKASRIWHFQSLIQVLQSSNLTDDWRPAITQDEIGDMVEVVDVNIDGCIH
jgi:hypothetical protein